MIKITDFSRFRMAVEQALGVSIEKLEEKLEQGGMSIQQENMIRGDGGLYSIIEKEGKLFAAKIILHIADKGLKFLARNPEALNAFYSRDYDSPDLINALHKYHLYNCHTIQAMFGDNRRHRYKQSHRQDGKFHYCYIKNNTPYINKDDQRLNICLHCLREFNRDREPVGMEEFRPEIFFKTISNSQWLPDCGYSPDTAPPPLYPKDFRKIAKKVKERWEHKCQRCGIVLNGPGLGKFLHCHHKDADKTNNLTANLLCLCIKCHAEQPMHEHMKDLSAYKEFLPIWENNHYESAVL